MNNLKKYFFILAILLVIINIVGLISLDSYKETRPIKLLSSIIFFVFFFKFKGYKNALLLVAFAFIIISDSFLINFELSFGYHGTFISSIIVNLLIGVSFLPKIKGSQIEPYLIGFFGALIFLNAYIIIKVISMIEFDAEIISHKIYLYAFGCSLIIMGVIAGVYNYIYGSEKSAYGIFFVFSVILSSIFSLFAFYFKLEFFEYTARIFHIVTLALFSIYAVSNLKETKLLNDEDLFV